MALQSFTCSISDKIKKLTGAVQVAYHPAQLVTKLNPGLLNHLLQVLNARIYFRQVAQRVLKLHRGLLVVTVKVFSTDVCKAEEVSAKDEGCRDSLTDLLKINAI